MIRSRRGGKRKLTDSQELAICDEYVNADVIKVAFGDKCDVSNNRIMNVLIRYGVFVMGSRPGRWRRNRL